MKIPSSPFKGEVRRGMGRSLLMRPIPTLALPLKGREQAPMAPGRSEERPARRVQMEI